MFNISKDFIIYNIKKKTTGFKGSARVFFVDYNPIDTNNIFDINRYLMKGT